MLRAGAVLCAAIFLLACEDTRSRRDGRASDAVRDRLGERPTDALRERRPADDRLRERGPGEAGLFACQASLGSASLQGTVQGTTLGASHALAANQSLPQAAPAAILLTAGQSGSCAAVHASGVVLSIGICQAAAGSYAIGQVCSNGSKAYARLPKGFAPDEASFGTIIVEAFDGSCGGKSKGSFVLSFPDQGGPALLSGSFDTVGCGPLGTP